MNEPEYYVVEFLGVKSPSILERVFLLKEDAVVYKSEHELGKFAAIITATWPNVRTTYLQEVLNTLGESPDKVNPLGFMGCVYFKDQPEENETPRCVIGQHLFDHGIDTEKSLRRANPTADVLYGSLFPEGTASCIDKLGHLAYRIQSFADGDGPGREDRKTWSEVIDYVQTLMEESN